MSSLRAKAIYEAFVAKTEATYGSCCRAPQHVKDYADDLFFQYQQAVMEEQYGR